MISFSPKILFQLLWSSVWHRREGGTCLHEEKEEEKSICLPTEAERLASPSRLSVLVLGGGTTAPRAVCLKLSWEVACADRVENGAKRKK